MSHLRLDVAIDLEQTQRVWTPVIVRLLREVADQLEGAGGATSIKAEWPDLEAWHAP